MGSKATAFETITDVTAFRLQPTAQIMDFMTWASGVDLSQSDESLYRHYLSEGGLLHEHAFRGGLFLAQRLRLAPMAVVRCPGSDPDASAQPHA